jgi:hypothetical protein
MITKQKGENMNTNNKKENGAGLKTLLGIVLGGAALIWGLETMAPTPHRDYENIRCFSYDNYGTVVEVVDNSWRTHVLRYDLKGDYAGLISIRPGAAEIAYQHPLLEDRVSEMSQDFPLGVELGRVQQHARHYADSLKSLYK